MGDDRVMSAGELLKQANRLKREGKLDEAIGLYQLASTLNPSFAWTYYLLGVASIQKQDFDSAIKFFNKSLEIDTNFHLSYLGLFNIFHGRGEINDAILMYQKAKQINSKTIHSESIETYLTRIDNYEQQINHLYNNQKWLDYPMNVSIETLSSCNAACDFCPYPSLERKGTKMSEELFKKIINELSSVEDYSLPSINLTRVNEPFLDKRIFDFIDYVNIKLPKTKIVLFTNASVLDESKLEKLIILKNIGALRISFNDHRAQEYERVMKIPFQRTYDNVERIHNKMATGEIQFPVSINRVGDGTVADDDFLKWSRETFPLFTVSVSARFDWIGRVEVNTFPVPDVGCRQWFMLHFLANGKEAFCCIDSDGSHGQGNVNSMNALDIYNHPTRRALRLQKLSRKNFDVCSNCSALS